MQNKQRKQIPLRISMVVLILLCWVLPILFTVAFSGYNTNKNTYAHASDTIAATVESATEIVSRDIDNAIAASINASYVPVIRNSYNELTLNQNHFEFDNNINNYLTQEYSRNHLIRSTYLLFPQNSYTAGQRYFVYNPSICTFALSQQFYTGGAAEASLAFMDTLDNNIAFMQQDGRLYMLRVMSLISNRFSPYSMLVMEINTDTILEPLRKLPWVTDITLLVNGGQAVLHPTGQAADTAIFPAAQEGALISRQGKNGRLLLRSNILQRRFTLDLYMQANLQPLLQEASGSLYVIFLLVVFSVILLALVFFFFVRKVTQPVGVLSGLAGRIESGEFGAEINAEKLGSAEFVYLGTQMNAMSTKLENQFERLYREELALRDARIKALQSQINPHFLGNTLEIINWEARLAGNIKVSRMLEALSTMMEAVLDRRRRPLVHLSEEMMYVNAYLYIIGERLGKRLTVNIDIPQNLLDWYIPRLVLQPLVENAVEHGVSARQHGSLTIRATRENDEWMLLEVINNSPLSPENEERIARLLSAEYDEKEEPSGNIGIRNVHQRLRILYGPESGLSVKNDKKGNAVSSIRIHLSQTPQENTI